MMVKQFYLGSEPVGKEIKLMGVLNVSPESFYSGSVGSSPEKLETIVKRHIEGNATWIDIGAQSTAPVMIYGKPTIIPVDIEVERIRMAVKRVKDISTLIEISVDTKSAEVAEVALKMGCGVINDISGLVASKGKIAELVGDHGASLILMATKEQPGDIKSIDEGLFCLKKSIELAERSGVDPNRIIIDPGIGGWQGRPHALDLKLLRNINRFCRLGKPVLAAISRKSTVGKIIGKPPSGRLAATLAATIHCIQNGVTIIRTHDTAATAEAIKTYQWIKNAR
ncbi:MAG: dihydropteroate synthase [Candidatus Hodarchaeales archaeon]|jgi:dihydropteroate synthase